MGQLQWEIIPDAEQLSKSLLLADAYDLTFEYNDFMAPEILDDEDELTRRLVLYESLGRDCSRDTLHGPFVDLCLHSADPEIRKVSQQRAETGLRIAEKLGVKGVVFHAGLIPNYAEPPYIDNFLDRCEDFFGRMLIKHPSLEIYLENTFELSMLPLLQLAEKMRGQPRFGLCFDYAHFHAYTERTDPESFEPMMAAAKHFHLNDNHGDSDEHLAVGTGNVRWKPFFTSEAISGKSALIEVNGYEKQKRSLHYLETHGWL